MDTNTMIDKPVLFYPEGAPLITVLVVACKVAKENGLNHAKIRAEAFEAGDKGGKEILSRYFNIV